VELARIMGATRVLQGLPTREEYAAGLVMAEEWQSAREFDLGVLDKLETDEQRAIWEARLDRIRGLLHFRLLAVAALEMELSPRGLPAGSGQPTRRPAPVQTTLVTTPDQRFAITSHAPDGTKQIFRLSPQFALNRRAN
jgi:hypothetical protein